MIDEPPGGAHRDPDAAAERVAAAIADELSALVALAPAERLEKRYAKFRRMGAFVEGADPLKH